MRQRPEPTVGARPVVLRMLERQLRRLADEAHVEQLEPRQLVQLGSPVLRCTSILAGTAGVERDRAEWTRSPPVTSSVSSACSSTAAQRGRGRDLGAGGARPRPTRLQRALDAVPGLGWALLAAVAERLVSPDGGPDHVPVDGSVAPGYEPVAEVLSACGPGTAVAARVGGRLVVDIWTSDLTEQSLICTWSAIKPVTGACLLVLVDRGQIGLDDRVTGVWPDVDDDRLLVRHLLTHTAGRVTVPDVPLVDWDGSVAALAAHGAGLGAGRGGVRARPDVRSPRRRGRASCRRSVARPLPGRRARRARSGSTSTSVSPTPISRGSPTRWASIAAWWATARGDPASVRAERWATGSTSTRRRGAGRRSRR